MDRWVVGLIAWVGAIVVHEYGHVLFGVLVGVPRREMRVSLIGVPRVELRDGERWLTPSPLYVTVFRGHANTITRGMLFTSGGTIVQTLAVLLFGVGTELAGVSWVGYVAARVSVAIIFWYAVIEFVLYLVRRRPFGDFSSMWAMSRAWTLALFVSSMLVHVVAIAITR